MVRFLPTLYITSQTLFICVLTTVVEIITAIHVDICNPVCHDVQAY